MARIAALVGPLASVLRRTSHSSLLGGNHFIAFSCLILAVNPRGAAFLLLVLGAVLVLPLSADPLRLVPPERLRLWPLSRAERLWIRAYSLVFSPVPWVALALPLWAGRKYLVLSCGLIVLALASNGAYLLWSRWAERQPQGHVRRWFPLPNGRFGSLLGKNLREQLRVLDPYVGLLLCLAGSVQRWLHPPMPTATRQGLALLVALSFSSLAQRLFALEGRGGFLRYALWPLKGWQILLAKDLAFLLLLLLLVLPLAPLSGLAAGLTLLAIGHGPSVLDPQPQAPWRFTVGVRGWWGPVQVLAMFLVGSAAGRQPLIFLPLAGGVWLLSLVCFGSRLEKRLAVAR